MPDKKKIIKISNFGGGLSQFDRVSITEGGFLRGSQLDYRTDPSSLQLNKDEVATSLASTIDLAKWIVPGGLTTPAAFTLDGSGYIKKRNVNGVWTDFSSHASSAGQGLGYWRGDDKLFFTNYGQAGFYGPLEGTPTYNPSWQSLNLDNDFHPVRDFRDFLAFGNGRQVATWDAVTWDADRLILPTGWRIRAMEQWNEYLAVGCWRGQRLDSDDKGIIFFWDGVSTTYNFFVETKGAVSAMKTIGSELFILSGSKAEVWKYNGGLTKVGDFPGTKPFGDYISINPSALAERAGMLMVGAGAQVSTASFARGVYSYGSNHPALPDTFNLEYLGWGDTATAYEGNQWNNIGALGAIQNKLLFSTYHSTNTGVPVVVEVDGASPFVTSRGGRYESLIINDGTPHKSKRGIKFIANYAPVPSGTTMAFLYRADGGAWTTIGTDSTAGSTEFETTGDPLPFDFREVQLGCTFNQVSTDPQPKLYSMLLEFIEESPL